MNDKFLSVIVPVYNVEDYLKDCLDSLLNQDLTSESYEVICIDDGSPDNCGNILDEYAKKYNNLIIIHQENQGVSCARNSGLEIAIGKYIWFVDSDDLIANKSISLILCELQKRNYPDILYIGVKAFEDSKQSEMGFDILSINQETLEYRDWMFTEIIKAKIIKENHLRFDKNLFFGEDDVFCVFLEQYVNKIDRLDKVLYYYRQRKGSALHSEITEKNFDRYLKTFYTDLKYAEKYDFLGYKKDSVLNFFPNIMVFIAKSGFFKGHYYIRMLKGYNLFPLRKYKCDLDKMINKEKISGAKKIRTQACESYFKYILLRIFCLLRKNQS